MARTSNELSSAEIIAVEELNAIGNNQVPYKGNTGSYAGATLGAAGTVLTSNGATSAPTFQAAGGGGLTWGTSISAGSGVGLTMTSSDLSGANAFQSSVHTASGTLTACTTTQNTYATSRTYTLTSGSVTDNFIGTLFSRTNVTTGAGGTLLAQGPVVRIAGTDTQTAGTLTPSYNLLELLPSLRSTGSSINLSVPNSIATIPTNGHIYAVLGNTQSVQQTLVKLDTGTSGRAHIPIDIIALSSGSIISGGININAFNAATQALATVRCINIGNNFNTNSNFSIANIFVTNEQNVGVGVNSGYRVDNKSTDLTAAGGSGLFVYQSGVGGTGIYLLSAPSINSSTNGLVNYTLDNTQTGASVVQKIDTGTSAQSHAGLLINIRQGGVQGAGGVVVNSYASATQAVGATHNIRIGDNFNTSSTFSSIGIRVQCEDNASSGSNTGIFIDSRSTDFNGATAGAGLIISHTGVAGTAMGITGGNNINTTTNGLVNFTLGATQSGASVVQKIALGSSAQAHNGIQITGSNASSTAVAFNADMTTGYTGKLFRGAVNSVEKFVVNADGSIVTTPLISAAVGYLNIPQNSQSAAYTTVAADAGKHIYHPSADTTARTFTIDSNANVAYPIGTAITFVNDTSAGVVTIAITSDTMVLFPAGTTGSRTLAANGIATAMKVSATRWVISGQGLT